MLSANNSTTSLASTTTVSSRAPLTGSAEKKDFQAAFASLQSTYGFAASAPTPVLKKKSTSNSSPTTTSTTTPAVRAVHASTPKDFQSAFANLQSTYGFGGSAPMPIPKKQGADTNTFFSKFTRSSSAAK
ncbi:hypothetical protein B0H16DRAFT_956022 [Mycena metata]|uniref:Uncharacterized protein n=1 Tax=Mycena metata TaxID=1033252 RepID=A0AAD7K3F8_9AGAR|nr:hypothetical protein B0H16DRAFT_956022 [Mycena metata]